MTRRQITFITVGAFALITLTLIIVVVGVNVFSRQNSSSTSNSSSSATAQTSSSSSASVQPVPSSSSSTSSAASSNMTEIQAGYVINSTTKVALVGMGTGTSASAFGCGDEIVMVTRTLNSPSTTPIKTSLEDLFSITDDFYGQSGLYNSLYQSTLSVDSVTLSGTTAIIALSGNLLIAGECDTPRVEEQIARTVTQLDWVDSVVITINGETLDDALSSM